MKDLIERLELLAEEVWKKGVRVWTARDTRALSVSRGSKEIHVGRSMYTAPKSSHRIVRSGVQKHKGKDYVAVSYDAPRNWDYDKGKPELWFPVDDLTTERPSPRPSDGHVRALEPGVRRHKR
jgi:hypothetical protein